MPLTCIPYPRKGEPIRVRRRSDSPPTPATPTTAVVNEENEIDYSPLIQQQADGIRLQKNLRLMVKEMCSIQKKYFNDLKAWSRKWSCAFEQDTSSLASYETTQHMLSSVSSIGHELAKKIDNSHRELRQVLDLIPRKERYLSRQSQLEQVRASINRAESDWNAYNKRLNKLNDQLRRIKNQLKDISLNHTEKSDLKMQQRNVEDSIEQAEKDVEYAKKLYQRAEKNYCKDTDAIFEQSQEDELDRLESLRDPLVIFLGAFEIKHGSWQQAIENHDPQRDLNAWKQKFFSQKIRLPNTQ
ncbi:unnamed protein product [Rotaria sp. Silwood2]|nr:unnamed protein product [Rotaria sp. Silwood2]CAF3036972.1 unnamed protein product [Rotaria sp. Silwood2]CAF3435490.1 unnamed protein product [Rotaria sp. Silwood2]CAF4201707.1 unnamed protein product [Rotaria sp. Silwood2]CAF4272618.1 unnamed protein product [Rotaria sp. Silwood2]